MTESEIISRLMELEQIMENHMEKNSEENHVFALRFKRSVGNLMREVKQDKIKLEVQSNG